VNENFFEKTSLYGIVPVIKLDSPDQAVELAKALIDGGLPVAEITFRTAAAEESIRRVYAAFPDMLLGAGTVLTIDQVKRAIDAGASFVVSPGFNDSVVTYCVENNIPILPGCSSPSDIERALSFGLSVVKFFPAEASGGLPAIKAMAAPYTDVKFIPTGGINEKNLLEYLSFSRILACGGSWMVPDNLIRESRFSEITQLTAMAVRLTLGLKVGHVGVNIASETDVAAAVRLFSLLFGVAPRVASSGFMLDGAIEIMKGAGTGTHGHIAVGTASLKRARNYFERHGFKFNEASLKRDTAGQPKSIYFEEEVAGFALHLLQL
jgi:2-dehydro-3-deoxyphosphogluconate aldolase/(4S)-4-hydroxy-2-oxoglutarate aldolase